MVQTAVAAGHAVIFWVFVKLLTLVVADAGTLSHSGVMLISGLAAWLLCVRDVHRARLWQFVLAGYLAVALDIVIALTIESTAMLGRFDMALATTSIAALLPWVLVPWGTLMAAVSTIYGILLRRRSWDGAG
ncbi:MULTISPECIES: hypothetical protein [Methyloceanibacter]|uniref:hypothetical protein n=1 Tax=Methyloceanibacter TaxID=1484898 RepID=UPI0005EE45AF|nr:MULTISPECIES: hypothetical protein [Methyloceanibacter]